MLISKNFLFVLICQRGGYLFKPRSYEFWQGQTTRFHDRIQIKRIDPDDEIDESITKPAGNGWYYERLCP